MPTDVPAVHARPAQAAGRRRGIRYDGLVNAALALCVASGAIAFVEPSPYDVLLLPLVAAWFLGGFTVHRIAVPFIALVFLYNLGGFVALIPHLDEHDPATFMQQSAYLAAATVFFALFFAQNAVERAEVCLKAFSLSAVVAAACGIAGYFDIGGTGDAFTLWGRASGTFKDPNVMGSYLVLAALGFVQTLLLGRTRHPLLTTGGLLVVVAGLFLSFSRGAWGAVAFGGLMTVVMTYATSPRGRVRRRIVLATAVAAVVAVTAVVLLLSIDSVRELFLQRFALAQDYDTGETGRFGNQLRAIPMLMERLNGFGPVRFRLFFDLDSHNSFVGAFASYGWLGGGAFFLLVGLTIVVGFRVALSPSPVRRVAQVFWPALFVTLMQGFQIDIDHWRHLYLMLGVVWGLETARIKWLERQPVPLPGKDHGRHRVARQPLTAQTPA